MWWIALVGTLIVLSPSPVAAQSVTCGNLPPLSQLGVTKEQQLDNLLRRAIACVRAGQPDLARLALVRKGAYDRALEDLNVGLEKDPGLLLCQFARGDAYFHKGEYQKAIEDYMNGLDRVSNIEALSRRAEAYEKLGQQDKALADFKAVLEKAPADKGAAEGVARLTPERQQ